MEDENQKTLQDFRNKIDKFDDELFNILKKRELLVMEIFKWKKQNGIQLIDEEREKIIIEKMIEKDFFSRDFLPNVFHLIFSESHKIAGSLD